MRTAVAAAEPEPKVMVGGVEYPYPGFVMEIPTTDPVPKGPPLMTATP